MLRSLSIAAISVLMLASIEHGCDLVERSGNARAYHTFAKA